MENPENEDQVNHTPEPAADIEMPTVASADEQPDPSPQSNHTAKHTDGHTDPPKKPLQDSLVSAPGSWQIPPGALAASQSTNATAPAASKSAEKIEKVEQRIRDDPYDLDAWTILINEIQNSGDIAAIRDVYERVLKVFPTSARHWLGYLELELKHANFNEVENLFTRCLKTVLSVDLWKFYLNYIRRINSTDDGKLESDTRTVIEKAYDYVLNNVGIDKDSGPIWSDYIFFLKNAETSNTWEEQRKMDSMRRVYQRAVAIPLNNVEHLWKEYDQWENGLNRLTAKNFLREKSSAYMTARTALHEMKAFADTINKSVVAKPTEWSEAEVQQLDAWKQYIAWETGNPLQLEDPHQVTERVVYAYQQALIYQRFYPEIWYEFSNYYIETDKPDRALAVLSTGMEVLPSRLGSLLLHFAYVQLCETQKKIPEARKALDTLLEHLTQKIQVIEAAASEETEELNRVAAEERSAMDLGDDIDGELRERLRAREKQVEKEKNMIKEEKDAKIAVLAKACSQVWIIYIQFMRRSEGIKNARSIFTKARKFPYVTYHVFVASALMEYYNSKEPIVAGKIFELGLKSFGDDPDFVEQYLDFLIQLNDDNNTRALFERALAVMPNEKAGSIWRKFADYENKYGDRTGIERVEKRWRDAFPTESKLSIFVDGNSYLNIQVIKDLELGGKARQAKAAPPIQVQATIVPDQTPVMADKRGKDRKGNRSLLDAFHPERYPRPDFNQWQAHTPTADQAPAPAAGAATQPSQPPTGPAASAQAAMPKQPPPTVQLANMDLDAPAQSRWSQGSQSTLPEAVTYFLSQLPPPEAFDGPIINASHFMDIVLTTVIPPPPRVNLDDRPVRQSPPPPPTGPGGPFRAGMGGGRGRGRRPRDEFEENNPPHMRGMGPNRPPEYDLFRARQAKRRRDDQF
ncbi:mRNA 3'-end-processing protein rna14 [Umbelopsis nana]